VCQKCKFGIILILSVVIFPQQAAFSQEIDYRLIFRRDWEKARAFVSENETWMKQLSVKYDVSYPLAIAVVFPELVRYSALRDKMETTLLKTLYINLGDDYADFSIGQFQMKPSFAEALHKKAPMLKGRLRKLFQEKSKNDDKKKYRAAIVRDLEDPESQFLYLIAFLKICENVYPLEDIDEDERLRFLATAYNYSFQKSFDEVNKMTGKKFFYTKLVKGDSYSYADISVYWYANYHKIH
jgi:hypothetical protein